MSEQPTKETRVCKCDGWLVPAPKICGKFEDDGSGACMGCEHDKVCHEATTWFCVVSDNDSHWYLIRSEDRDRFNSFVNAVENEEYSAEDWKFFEAARINGPYFIEFQNWRERP